MHKINIVILLLTFFLTNCSGSKEPVIKLGKNFDETKLEVLDETAVFNKDDKFSYTLSQKNTFTYPAITRRFYKGKVYIDLLRVETTDINIEPGTKKINESIPVSDLLYKHGGGDYMIIFVVNEEVIAKKPFVIEGPAMKSARSEEQPHQEGMMPQTNNQNLTGKEEAPKDMEADKTITNKPEKIKMVSPSEIMKGQN